MAAGNIFPHMDQFIEGVGQFEDETILIYDVEQLLKIEDLQVLEENMENFP